MESRQVLIYWLEALEQTPCVNEGSQTFVRVSMVHGRFACSGEKVNVRTESMLWGIVLTVSPDGYIEILKIRHRPIYGASIPRIKPGKMETDIRVACGRAAGSLGGTFRCMVEVREEGGLT